MRRLGGVAWGSLQIKVRLKTLFTPNICMCPPSPAVLLVRSFWYKLEPQKSMLRRGVLSVAAFAQAQRTCAATAKGAVGAKAWLSGSKGENDDPTPAKTKLAFASGVYGKDPQAAAALSDEEAAEIEQLRMKARGGAAGAAAAPIHDSRNMYDSSLTQQAEDGKASGGIKRDVSADTPDATRVAFGATAYGKDPQAAAEVAAEVEELRRKAQGASAAAGAAAAPIHSSRSLFDSDLTQVFSEHTF